MNSVITFDNIIEDYFNYSKVILKESTFIESKYHINRYILPYFHQKNIYEVDLRDVVLWKNYILKKNFSYNYESNLYYHLCSLFDYLVKFYDLKKNYAKIEGNFKNRDLIHSGNIWTYEEFNKFIKSVDNKKYQIIFNMLFFGGMRKGELLALTRDDINFNDNTIIINKTLTNRKKVSCPKTFSSNRIIHLNNKIMDLLYDYVKDKEYDELIFNIGFTQLERMKNLYCKKSGVKQIKIHEFRHSHACYLFNNNIPIDEISHRLGHSNLSTTMDTYLKYLPIKEKRVEYLLNSIN